MGWMKMTESSKFVFKLPALRILENEHHLIRHLMSEWHPIVLEFEKDAYTLEEAHVAIKTLEKKIIAFIDPLKNHTEKEEEYVFKALAKYVGDEQGPVKATEEEHEEIDAYIGHFLHHVRGDVTQLDLDDMKQIVQDAGEAFEVITFHLVKEESVVFPMVQDILDENEKYDLLEKLYSPII